MRMGEATTEANVSTQVRLEANSQIIASLEVFEL